MREELRDSEVTEVNAGAVIMSEPLKRVGFNAIGELYKIKGPFKEMRNLMIQLYDENEALPGNEFDILVRDEFKKRGWI